ncbi:MAG TPA: sigma-54-dependent Fis family transcriptional regulator [Candidatus Binataceae bacterium]|nr:sigma-54-dependent Fis family transcriptional regulator [Candidatus Binataceae bacterium]
MEDKNFRPRQLVAEAGSQYEGVSVGPDANSTRPERFALLYELGCAFAARIELAELIPLVVAKCREVLNAEGISVMLLDAEHNEFYFPYVAQVDPEIVERLLKFRFPAEMGVAGCALKEGVAIRVIDAQIDPRHYHGADRVTGMTTRDLLAVPLITHQGKVGVIEAVNCRGPQPFTEDDLAFFEALGGSIAIAIENARLYAQVRDSEASLRTRIGVLRRDLARTDVFNKIIGTTPGMIDVFRLMESAAASSIPVLIEGETGTGKELVARGIHMASARSEGPFVAINCASLPETLLESELFGHRRGAFTGAIRDNPGLFRAANGGVIFLDEISDMPITMQAKLLRVLEEEEVVAIGDNFPRKVDVRVLSATNRDLKAEVERGNFRQDLYYRVAVFPIKLPPLRQRREDITPLAMHFLGAAAERHHKRIEGFAPETIEILTRYDWPGNVRELRNEIERAVAIAREGDAISPNQLTLALGELFAAQSAPPAAPSQPTAARPAIQPPPDPERIESAKRASEPLRKARAAFEARHIAEALLQHQSNVSRTAQALGLSRAALQKKMKAYGLR